MQIIWFLMILIWPIQTQNHYCYSDIISPYLHFSLKTSYETVRAHFIKTPKYCTPHYVWGLVRHGAKYCSANEIKKMNNLIQLRNQILLNHQQGRGELCEKDLNKLKNWTFSLNENVDSGLAPRGKEEQISLAKRLKKRFPELFSTVTKENLTMQTSPSERVIDGAIAFANELLGTQFTSINGNNITVNRKILQLAKFCTKYNMEVWDNPETYSEYYTFLKSEEVKRTLHDISKRLGFEHDLLFNQINSMYEICSYENSWQENSKPAYCAAFTEDNLKVFEYITDLDYYWGAGYGNPMNEKLGCNLVKDVMNNLKEAARSNSMKKKATFYFSHSEIITLAITKLDLNRDQEPLRHDNYNKMKDNRKWKLSLWNSFSSNIIAVLFKCPNYHDDIDQVVFYQSEHEVTLPGCNSSPCSLKLLQKHFEDVDKCNLNFCFDNLSTNNAHSKNILSSGIKLLITFILFRFYF